MMQHALSCDSGFPSLVDRQRMSCHNERLAGVKSRSVHSPIVHVQIRLLVDTRVAQRCRIKNNKHILAGRGQPAMLSLRYISFVSGSREGVWVNELRSVKNKRGRRARSGVTSARSAVSFLRFPNRECHASCLRSPERFLADNANSAT